MKKIICILISILLTASSITITFACEDPKDKNQKQTYVTVNVNDSTTGSSLDQFMYVGNWNYGKQSGAYMGDNHWSNTKDSYYTVSFNGTQIKLYGAKANYHGIAAVSIDGGREKEVDFNTTRRADNTLVYTSSALKDGVHTLKVRVTGQKKRKSRDCTITADKVEIKECSKQTQTQDTQAPSVPSGLTAMGVSGAQINLYWTASTDNIGVKGYKVFRNGQQIGTVTNGTAYSDKGLAQGTYSYTISAYDAAGNNSAACTAVTASTMASNLNLALNKPSFSDSAQQGYDAGKGNDGSLSTMWCAADGAANHWWVVDLGVPSNISGTEVTWQFGQKLYRYKVEVSENNVNWTLKADKTNNTSTEIKQTDSFSANAIRYVRITVIEAPVECWAAFYEFKVFGASTPVADTLAPSIPVILSASAESTTKINLKWNASTDNIGVSGYKVFRNGAQVGTVTNGTSYSDSGLTPNTTYSYTISAYDAASNNSAQSAQVNVTTKSPSVTNISQYKVASSDSVQPGYNASNGNDGNLSTLWCAADGNANHWWKVDLGGYYNLSGSEVTWQFGQKIYKYKVEVSSDDSNWSTATDKTNNQDNHITQKDDFTANGIRYVRITVTGVPSECWAALYEFKVFGSQVGISDTQAPTVPAALTVSAISTTKISIIWSDSTDNVGVQGYKIYRDNKQISTVTSGTAFTDTALTPGKTYSYSVSAFDGAGNNSAKSTTVSIATQTPVITNIALFKNAISDTQHPTNTAMKGNDGSLSTRWSAADSNPNHWWMVDLGANYNLTGTEVTWELSDKEYKYKIEVSNDNVNWTLKVDKTGSSSKQQIQKNDFSATSVRYVRITVTGLQANCSASFYEFKVFGYTA